MIASMQSSHVAPLRLALDHWAFAFTYGMLWLIDLITPVKVDQTDEERGLDEALHGETAYLGAD